MNFRIILLFIFISILNSCKKQSTEIESDTSIFSQEYSVLGTKIYKKNKAIQLIGANTFHVFSAGSNDMNAWNLDIAREFVGNVQENPITGSPILDANGSYLHSLQAVVDSNRKNNRITLFCPFGWNGVNNTTFSSKMPVNTSWWNNFKSKLSLWAIHFKNQPDVWIEVWNEPYRYDRTDGYTDEIWLDNMNELYALIRNTGNKNIVLIPCAEQGQDESVFINEGLNYLKGKSNVLFDVHAYEKWLLVPKTEMGNRLSNLQQNNLPIIFGETAPMNAGSLMNPSFFLDSIYNRGISVAAWLWKYDGNDKDALLNAQGEPNNNNNNNWGTTFKNLSLKERNP
jgi:mannan endo-1,4-beta-mannosidase